MLTGRVFMIGRTTQQRDNRVPLYLDDGMRIVTQAHEPVLGWLAGERAGPAEHLYFSQKLLAPRATENISYACNLPALLRASEMPEPLIAAADGSIEPALEARFLEASLPGGQVAILSSAGSTSIIAFRWLCAGSGAAKGIAWRLFVRMRSQVSAAIWAMVPRDYVFDRRSGSLVDGPDCLQAEHEGQRLALTHPGGMLTCLPARSLRVKITILTADGRARRELTGIILLPDRSIIASFSDGSEEHIATSSSASAFPALAA